MTFALFFLGEYANMILMCALTADPVPGRLAAAVRHRAAHLDPGPSGSSLKMLLLSVHLRLGAARPCRATAMTS